MLNKKCQQITTVVIPFSFDRLPVSTVLNIIIDEALFYALQLEEKKLQVPPEATFSFKPRLNFGNPLKHSSSEPAKNNRAADLRREFIFKQIDQFRAKEEEFELKRIKAKLVRSNDKVGKPPVSESARKIEDKLRQTRMAAKLELLKFKADLDEMYQRVKSRPSLIERQAHVS